MSGRRARYRLATVQNGTCGARPQACLWDGAGAERCARAGCCFVPGGGAAGGGGRCVQRGMPRVVPGQGLVVASAGDGALMPGEGERGEETLQLAEEESAAFSEAVVELLSSRARWEHESEGARARVAAHFTAEKVHWEVREMLDELGVPNGGTPRSYRPVTRMAA